MLSFVESFFVNELLSLENYFFGLVMCFFFLAGKRAMFRSDVSFFLCRTSSSCASLTHKLKARF